MNQQLVFVAGLAVSLTCACLSTAQAAAPGPSQQELDHAAQNGQDWLYADHDYFGQRYSALTEITSNNVERLTEVCKYTFPEKEPGQTAPIAYQGRLYATTAHHTVALDGANCKVIWQTTWTPKAHETFGTQRGAAIKDGKILRGTADGYLLALDAQTGKLLWSRQIADPAKGYFISMPPLIVGDLVIIGPAGAEWAAKGWVGAFKLSDGSPVWQFNIIPNADEPGAKTWGPDPAVLTTAGGNLWTPLSYDPAKKWVYVHGGNPAPDFYDKSRPGANLYTNSLIALDVETGKLAWFYQAVPHDTHDYDLTHSAPVFETTVAGVKNTLITLTGKDGLLRVYDRDARKLVYAVPFTTRTNADTPLSTQDTYVCPGVLGGHEWNGGAYSPKLSTLFVPTTDWCATMKQATEAPAAEEQHVKGAYFGGDLKMDPWEKARGWLTAFDAATGAEKWKAPISKPMIGGIVATAGNLLFAGELNGDVMAFDAASGKVLTKVKVSGPVGGGLISYAAAGHQHVAVVSGYVGYYNILAPELGGANPAITIFALKK
jgi:alcohol dehydrogenase (cytochrome c)